MRNWSPMSRLVTGQVVSSEFDTVISSSTMTADPLTTPPKPATVAATATTTFTTLDERSCDSHSLRIERLRPIRGV
jgi:hypothetical protein